MAAIDSASLPLHWRKIALIVLAAGRSSRMGRPKALVELAGRPLLGHLLRPPILQSFGAVVVVLGHHGDRLKPIVERAGFEHVLNPDPDRGRTGSLQAGLRALPTGIAAAFVQPVDCPLIRETTYEALRQAFAGADAAIPMLGGRAGHPPLISSSQFARLLVAGPDAPLADLLAAAVVRRRAIEVGDPGVLINVDRPEDLAQLAALLEERGELR